MKDKFPERFLRFAVFAALVAGAVLLSLLTISDSPAVAFAMGPFQEDAPKPFASPPEDQTYIGTKQ